MIDIEIANEQSLLPIDERRLCAAARSILDAHEITDGEVSLAIVDDATIHRLNRDYLAHDYATDVLSFLLESRPGFLQGQVVASAETAARSAAAYGWTAADELLLYVVHGTLHLAGLDDQSPEAAAEMRSAEVRFLAPFGLTPRYDGAAERAVGQESEQKGKGAECGAPVGASPVGASPHGERIS